jgi:hypothetical protein
VGGWWKERIREEICEQARYAVIVTLASPEVEIQLYQFMLVLRSHAVPQSNHDPKRREKIVRGQLQVVPWDSTGVS